MDLFPYILLIAAVLAFATGLLVWMHARQPGMKLFTGLVVSAGLWSFGLAMETLSVGAATQIAWAKFQYLGIATLPVFWFLFAFEYSGQTNWIRRWIRIALWGVPAITLILVLTNGQHGLIWSAIRPASAEPGSPLVYTHGWWFWTAAIYGC